MASVSGRRTGEDATNASGGKLEGGNFIGEGDVEDGIRACAPSGIEPGGWRAGVT